MEDLVFPSSVRKVIYVVTVLVSAVLVPLEVAGVLHPLVMPLWTSVAGAVSGLAALNTPKGNQ